MLLPKWSKPSPTSNNCHQHISFPTSVTNIDVTFCTNDDFSVSSSDYPFGYWFPPFCNGPCAGIPIDISKKLLTVAESRKQSSFGLEDVLFTGIYRQIANVTNIRRLPYICEHFR